MGLEKYDTDSLAECNQQAERPRMLKPRSGVCGVVLPGLVSVLLVMCYSALAFERCLCRDQVTGEWACLCLRSASVPDLIVEGLFPR